MNRTESTRRVRSRKGPWDIIVIGGGATGIGCAVDAASRGYDVLLLEQHDLGKGTSSRSTKLVHGGVRYLEQGNISLVREALMERAVLLRNAPHIVHKQKFVVPCYSQWQKLYYWVGLKLYDSLSGKNSFGRSRILSKIETLETLPGLAAERLKGGVSYFDGQFDDMRLLIDLAETASEHGAVILNYSRVSALTKDSSGLIDGLVFEDIETRESFSVGAKVVINATGAFCDSVRRMSDETSEPIVTLSQGIHLVLDSSFLSGETAIMIPKTTDGRVLFCIPWNGKTLVGTTDTVIGQAELEPRALGSEIDFVLATSGSYLKRQPTRNDILSVFTGIRPLVRSDAKRRTAQLSRGHTIEVDGSRMLTIAGGKWTTYRKMAEDAIDEAASLSGLEKRRCVTASLAIGSTRSTSEREGIDIGSIDQFGESAIKYYVRHEGARTIEDVLARRTRLLFLDARLAVKHASSVAELMARELGKDANWVESQTSEFTKLAESYLDV